MKTITKSLLLSSLCLLCLTACGTSPSPQAKNVSSAFAPNEAASHPSGPISPDTETPPAPSRDDASPSATDTPPAGQTAPSDSSFLSLHGALHVEGKTLKDQNGGTVQLKGLSTHGLAWFPQYVSYDTFETLRDDWNANCVRLALYTAEYGGYCAGGDREALKTLIQEGVDYATELGMYVIIDWHILSDQDPQVYKPDALSFFEEMSALYAQYDNVIYEICNEPNGYATWDSVKSYAQEVIPVIRANDGDAVILVGTPTWSQDIHKAAEDPLAFDNILYTLHFYAGTHKDDLRNRLKTCLEEDLPVFVSEFGLCDASGNGANDFDSSAKWLALLNENDISYIGWNLANKNESSSVIRSDCDKTAHWTPEELSEAGRWLRETFLGERFLEESLPGEQPKQ